MKAIHECLSEKRKENGYSQSYVASKVGIVQSVLSRYECGRTVPGIYVLIELADLYEVTLDELVGRLPRKEVL